MRRSALAVLLLVAAGCSAASDEAREFVGSWESTEWGIYLTVEASTATFYEFVEGSCLEAGSGGVRGIDEVLDRDGAELVLSDAGRLIRFSAVDFLPERCAGTPDPSPGSVYDVAVATVEAHHAPGVDAGWSQRVAALRPTQDVTPDELVAALTALLEPLDHPDVRLAVPARDTWSSATRADVSLLDGERLGAGVIVRSAVGEEGTYLGFERVGGFDPDPQRSSQVAGAIVDEAVAAAAVVLDLRAADDGTVADAMVIASRFVPEDRVVARFGVGGTGDGAGVVTVAPLPLGTYQGDLYVLVGSGTSGAAELLVAAVRDVDGVTLIGGRTAGSPAPRLVRQLPNGWAMAVSNLMTTGVDGVDLSTGIEPDVVTSDPLGTVSEILGVGLPGR